MGIAERIRDSAVSSINKDLPALRELIEKRSDTQFWKASEEKQVEFLTKMLECDLELAAELADALGWEQPLEDSPRLAAAALLAARQENGLADPDLVKKLNWTEWKLKPDLPKLQKRFEESGQLRTKFAELVGLRPGRLHLREVARQAIVHNANNGRRTLVSPQDQNASTIEERRNAVRKCLESHLLSWNALKNNVQLPAFLRALKEDFAFRQEVARITVYEGEEAENLARLAIEMLRAMPAHLAIDAAIEKAENAVNFVVQKLSLIRLTVETPASLAKPPREWFGLSRRRLVEELARGGDLGTELATRLDPVKGDLAEHQWQATQKQLAQEFAKHPALPLLLWREAGWPYPFALVLREELRQIEARRKMMQPTKAAVGALAQGEGGKQPEQGAADAKPGAAPAGDGGPKAAGSTAPAGTSTALVEKPVQSAAEGNGAKAATTATIATHSEASVVEVDQLAAQPKIASEPQTASAIDVSDLAAAMELTGIAFSGGGIRSATFNLGVLQKLAEMGLLRKIDYLSTVSGGGYIGSWLAGWIRDKKLAHVEESLSPKTSPDPRDGAVRPIGFLREFSNYLTPMLGAFSFDTWTMVAVYFRNVLLNQATLLGVLGTLLLIPRFVGLPMYVRAAGDNLILYTAIILMIVAIIGIACNMRRATALSGADAQRSDRAEDMSQERGAEARQNDAERSWFYGPVAIHLIVVSSMLLAVYFGSLWFWSNTRDTIYALDRWRFGSWIAVLIFVVLAALLALVGGFWQSFGKRLEGDPEKLSPIRFLVTLLVVGGTAGANLGLLRVYAGIMHWLHGMKNDAGLWNAEIWGPILLLIVFIVPGILQTGLMGVDFPDSGREWMSRFRAVCIVYTLMWIGVMSATIYGPRLVFRSAAAAKAWLAGVTFTWIVTTVGSFLAGKSEKTGRDKEGKPKISSMQVLARVGPPVFVAGLLVLIATGEQSLLVRLSWPHPLSLAELSGHHWLMLNPWMMAGWGGILMKVAVAHAIVAFILAWRVDINEFSMHNFYKNRLVRCYLGASHQERKANAFTGFDDTDDFPLSELTIKEPDQIEGSYQGPYPIINTTLNLSAGEQLAWQERKAASFIFSPCFCGFDLAAMNGPGSQVTDSPRENRMKPCAYRRTAIYSRQKGPSLGTAFSISGAAANPNQGYNTSPAVAFLMTVFNVRLGGWVGNPRRDKESQRPSPRFGLASMVSDLLGRTDDRTHFVNLSDGGHFDNMGIYELVRRRCRYIILCDAEQDATYKFGGLGMVIRKCRIDFGAHIDIDPSRIVPNVDTKRSDVHCAVGTIRYLDGSRGTLVYIKSSVTGDEPEDVLEYRASQAQFPHQSTGDQWFDESQFESYRALGYHAADQALSPSDSWRPWDRTMDSVKPLFTALEQHWYRLNPNLRGTASKHTATLAQLLNNLRQSPGLQQLGAELFPNSGVIPSGNLRNPAEEFFFCMALIQLVEDVYFEFELDKKEWLEDPRIGGWCNLFRTWKNVPMVSSTWAAECQTFREDFQRFWNNRI